MPTGALTEYIDVAQLVLYAFWLFFAGLIYYLHTENKREGYPLESDRSARAPRVKVQGWPPIPKPKTYRLQHGGTVSVPRASDPQPAYSARPVALHPGAALAPVGDAMASGAGPGAIALRADVPDVTWEGGDRLVPLRRDRSYDVSRPQDDPRGWPVVGADGAIAGHVHDLWVDRSEALFRYLEVSVPKAAKGPHVLLPVTFARLTQGRVEVRALLGAQIADGPRTRNPDAVTRLEEERITAWYGAGTLYATRARQEPLF